jgi:uncharacterized membrane protein YgdD (TMEM256/DUF423 family)
MRLGRVRAGELLALAGATLIVVSLFERWYEGPGGTLDAWDTFAPAVVLLLIAAIAAIALFAVTVAERAPVIPVVEVSTIPLGLAAVIAAIVRVLERPDGATSVCIGAWLALAGAVAVFAGAWYAMHDEHRALYPPATPTPRPRP